MKPVGEIDWVGSGRPWTAVLTDVLLNYSLTATVNWSAKEITFARAEVPTTKDVVAASTGAPVAEPQEWVLKAGKSLRENLEVWASTAGWHLHWAPKDLTYAIPYEVRFRGDLVGETGVIALVIAKYESAPRPLKVKFYDLNNVVSVYEPAQPGFRTE